MESAQNIQGARSYEILEGVLSHSEELYNIQGPIGRGSKSFRGTLQHHRKHHATLDQADPNQTKRSSRFASIGQTDII